MQVGEVPRLAIPMKSAQQIKLITCKLARCQERLAIPIISSADKLNYMQVN